MMLPSPAMAITRLGSPRPTQAPIAAGRSYPIVAQPELVHSRWPRLMIAVWKPTTQALPLPQTTTSSSSSSLNRASSAT